MLRILSFSCVGLLIFSGCIAENATMMNHKQTITESKPTLTDERAIILENASNLLREEKLQPEANEVDKLKLSFLKSIQQGEGSVFLGVDPSRLLSGYAERLQKMGREESATKMKRYSKAYYEINIQNYLQWQNR